jgi:hypothetical protein
MFPTAQYVSINWALSNSRCGRTVRGLHELVASHFGLVSNISPPLSALLFAGLAEGHDRQYVFHTPERLGRSPLEPMLTSDKLSPTEIKVSKAPESAGPVIRERPYSGSTRHG